MSKLLEFIKKERLYILILLFLILIQVLSIYGERKIKSKVSQDAKSSTLNLLEEDFKFREKLIDSIAKGKNAFAVMVLFSFIVGLIVSFLVG
ncbi:MAG: hypothetical protein FJZ16_10085, partial [Candidatus Omnitrophica bacterium]|nr:hypothetical protein [Candidatus Omnitrophota bacterium]